MLPYSRVARRKVWNATTRLQVIGPSTCQLTTSSMVTSTITSGKWAIQVLAVLAQRFTWILVHRKKRLRCQAVNWLTRITHRSSKSGTSCSCSTTARLMVLSNHSQCTLSIQVWASSAWFACCRISTLTMIQISSSQSSRKLRQSLERSMASLLLLVRMVRARMSRRRSTSLCVFAPTTSVP